MNIKQKQHLLAFLGYYTGAVDGIWGNLSQKATEAFQAAYGLPVGQFTDATEQRLREVIYNQEEPTVSDTETVDKGSLTTGTFWDEIEYFDPGEDYIACPCGNCGGFPVQPVERLMRNADATRKHFGKPMIPTSTVRCVAHNASLKGSAANSLHTGGKAMDFGIPGVSADTIVAFCWTLPEVHECYPIDESHVHMGVQKY